MKNASNLVVLLCIVATCYSVHALELTKTQTSLKNRRLLDGSSSFASASASSSVTGGQLTVSTQTSGKGSVASATASNGDGTISVSSNDPPASPSPSPEPETDKKSKKSAPAPSPEPEPKPVPETSPALQVSASVQGEGSGSATASANGQTISVSTDEEGTVEQSVPASSPPTTQYLDVCMNGDNLPNGGEGTVTDDLCCRCPAENKCSSFCSCKTGECVKKIDAGLLPTPFTVCANCKASKCEKFHWCPS